MERAILLLVLGVGAGAGSDRPDSTVLRARDLCYLQDYRAAADGVSAMVRSDTADPAGVFWQACLLQMLIYDSGNTALIDSFYRTTDRVVALCRKRREQNPRDVRARLYWGLAELNRANCLSWQGKKFAAFMTMLRVPAHLRQVVGMEPEVYDAQFGLGVIEYFKATADRYCFGLGLIGSRERAYALVRSAQTRAVLMQPMAEFLLGFMMKEDGFYEGAIRCCERLLARYPDNRSARRLLRDIYLDMGRYREMLELARRLEQDIRRAFPENRYGLSENWLKMAYGWERIGAYDSVCAYSERIIAWERYQDRVPWLKNYVREAKELKRRSERRLRGG